MHFFKLLHVALAFAFPATLATPIAEMEMSLRSPVRKTPSKTLTGSVTATHATGGGEYVSEIEIDGQKHRVLLDTGSSGLWIKDEKHSGRSGNPFSIHYGDHGDEVTGVVVEGNVTVGGLTVPKQSYGLAHPWGKGYKTYDGILGLGLSSTQYEHPKTSTWLSNIMPMLKEELFTVKMVEHGISIFTFGYIDSHYRSEDALYLNVRSGSPHFDVNVASFGVPHGDMSAWCDLDTGTTFSHFPPSVLSQHNHGEYCLDFKCSNNSSDPGHHCGSSGTKKICQSLSRAEASAKENECILGQDFLFGQYVIYDWSNKKVGLLAQQ